MIDICNVSKRYGSVYALSDVSLQVQEGSVLGLLGQNGAGKTTLLNIITGYLAATQGHVSIHGHDPLLAPEAAKSDLGYLPEHPPLYDEMTVEEYLRFVCRLRGVVKASLLSHTEEIMQKTGLTDMRNRILSHLSKGYRQRVGMAQALCGDPKILILDEPTVGLDPKQITEIRTLIQNLSKGRTIIFSSHILSEVQQLCSHVAILHKGRIQLDAPMEQIQNSNTHIALLCTIATSQDKLLPALRQLDGIKEITPQQTAHPSETTVMLSFSQESNPETALFTLMSRLNYPIIHLSRCRNSLEQIFLQVIAEE